ncbi:HET-domain-containing protein [Coniochaeta ligniaria NRRL 30616]|uniref:HET-domain-containing protein n=1 Tax=Coniochaeta ligniaria NRRL 30616 TaxID=1408157 RepID=A0A1J7IZL2_9PEZI|nr:HET-domain-containing protein [Coniochaeta ligniaria NRRL 30616]
MLIGRWIDERADSHQYCSLQGEDVPIATRLLDLYPAGKVDHVALVDGKYIATTPYAPFYATLSHRWGKHAPIRTTKANEYSHRDGIRVSSLPQTLQDAVKVARAYFIQYLWIDTLCVVQDSEVDQGTEFKQWELLLQCPLQYLCRLGGGLPCWSFLCSHRRHTRTRPFKVQHHDVADHQQGKHGLSRCHPETGWRQQYEISRVDSERQGLDIPGTSSCEEDFALQTKVGLLLLLHPLRFGDVAQRSTLPHA